MSYSIGFIMDQIAGHVTNYRNLRKVAESDSEIVATWNEIYYRKEGGKIERYFSFLPTYYTGVSRGIWEINKALKSKHYDVVMSNASVGVFFANAFRRIPTLLDFDSTPMQIDRMPAYGINRDLAPLSAFKFKLSQNLYRSATLLQSWSNWAKDSVVKDYGIDPQKIVVNPPGINLEYWAPSGDAASPKGDRPKRVLFVGADFTRKGGGYLLEWYKDQPKDQIELHIVTKEKIPPGNGIYVYSDMAPNTSELRALYHQSDVFVLPSLGECFGIATIEAMGTGLPVVVTDVGGTADIVESGRNGLIVQAGDSRALGNAILQVLNDETVRQEMGSQSRLIAERKFSLEQNARKTLLYLKQIARHQVIESMAEAQI